MECDHVRLAIGVSYRLRGLNSNTFLDSGNCFALLRKNNLPVAVVYLKIVFISRFYSCLFHIVLIRIRIF